MDNHTIPVRKVSQNNQDFYVGVFTISEILQFTRYTERLIVSYDEENRPIYNPEIQRKVEKSRVDKIADFLIDDPDAVFPTNIVISIPNPVIESVESKGILTEITLSSVVFKEVQKKQGDIHLTIIDGQHRVKGIEKAIERLKAEINASRGTARLANDNTYQERFERYTRTLNNLLNIEMMVSFFIDKSLEFQAMIFSTINRTQKSVPQSLVYSLFGLTTNPSPQKTALETVLSLNSFEKSPFYNRIKLYGGTYQKGQSPPLTQNGMVKSIVDLISVNLRESERDRFKPRQDLLKNITPERCFRRYYATDEDYKIVDILFSFFSSVKQTFADENNNSYWEFQDNNKPSNVLQTTVGYQALILLMIDILKELPEDKKDEISAYTDYLKRAKGIDFEDIGRYPFTSKTKKILYLDMSLRIWPPVGQDDRIDQLNELDS